MLTFGLRLILLLLVIGGTIAVAGNYIGRAIGRRRLTILGLRPRYTATAITVISGILIAVITIGVMLMVSRDARTALFGLEELRKDLAEKSSLLEKTKDELSLRAVEKDRLDQNLAGLKKELTAVKNDLAGTNANLKKAKREIASLEKAKEKLDLEVAVSRRGKVLFKVDEILITSLIQAGPEKAKVSTGLKQILSAADAYVRGFGVKSDKHLILVSPDEFERALDILTRRRGENLVAVIARRNSVFGETVPVRFEISENSLVYKSGEEIAEAVIAPALSTPEIEQEIKKLLSITRLTATRAGILPEASGAVGSVAYADIFSLAKKIRAYNKGVRLKTIAKNEIYKIGPLEVDFKILYQ